MLQMNKTALNRTAVSDLNPIPVFDYAKIKFKPILSIKVGKPFFSLIDAYFQKIGIRAPEKNNSTPCLSYGPSTALHPSARIPICAGGCVL
jgi:hypothetical protein